MTVCIPTLFEGMGCPPTSKSTTSTSGTVSQQRAPTDALFYADVNVENVVVGSRWMLGYDIGDVFTELDSGTVVTTNFVISNVPAYGSPFLLELRVRKSSAQPKYEKVNQFSFHNSQGITMYISQVLDKVAT